MISEAFKIICFDELLNGAVLLKLFSNASELKWPKNIYENIV